MNWVHKTRTYRKFRKKKNLDGKRRFILGKETKGGESIFKDEGLYVLGEFGVSCSENEAQFLASNWVSINSW